MVFWIASVVGLAIAYLFGSTPTGYLAGMLLRPKNSEARAVVATLDMSQRARLSRRPGDGDRIGANTAAPLIYEHSLLLLRSQTAIEDHPDRHLLTGRHAMGRWRPRGPKSLVQQNRS